MVATYAAAALRPMSAATVVTDIAFMAGPTMRNTNAAPGETPFRMSDAAIGMDAVEQTYIGKPMIAIAGIASQSLPPNASAKKPTTSHGDIAANTSANEIKRSLNMFMVPGVSGWLKADAEIPGILENINEPDEEPKNIKILAKSVIYNREQDDTMAAKPMNCPNAMMTYKRTNHSYKELPIRYSEYDVLHRKEKSGQMNGLFRVQEFRQDDDHTFVMESQIKEEIADIIAIADEIYSTFGVTYRAEFSTRPDDFMGDIEVWNRAEAALKEILDEKYGEGGYEINEGDGAFYGPKIDLQIKDALGREWQCGTVQLDFQLPHNFGLTYQAQDGTMQMPVVIHRAIYGSLERFIGIIIENFKGVFPFWLSPYQVGIVPIRVEHNEYAKKVEEALVKAGIRVEADYSDNNMKEKIKKFKNYKDPYIIVVGDKEAQENTVSINVRGSNKQVQNVPLDALVEMCKKMNEEHSLELIDSYEA